MIKALAGGGGRGMRVVRTVEDDRRRVSAVRARRRSSVSATPRCSPSSARERPAHRSADRRHGRHGRWRWATAIAVCSAGIRNSSKSLPRRDFRTTTAQRPARRGSPAVRPCRVSRTGDRRIPGLRRRVRVPRGQSANPGGAHRDRGGDRGRSGRRAARDRRGRALRRPGVAARNCLRRNGIHRRTGRRGGHRDPGQSEHGDDGGRRFGGAERGHADHLRTADRAGCASRHLRPPRADPEPALRLAAGQGDHPNSRTVLPRRRPQDRDSARRVHRRPASVRISRSCERSSPTAPSNQARPPPAFSRSD